MKTFRLQRSQKGAVIVIAMIMLVVFTVMMAGAFTLSSVNLTAVGNMQSREEALAAANMAVELKIGQDFTSAPVASSLKVDINNDGTPDYLVAIDKPICMRASVAQAVDPSSVTLNIANNTWNTVWQIVATASDLASGAQTRVRTGVRVLLSNGQYIKVCP